MLVRVVVHKIDKVTEAFESRIRSLDEYMEELEKYMIASNENSMARFYNFSYCRRKEDQLEPLRSLKTSEIIPELENMTSGGLYNLRSEQLDSILDALTIKDVPDNDNLKRRRIRLACGIVFQDVRELLG
ncbi:hypothetical protein GGR53DRAFT_496749 [Hypoxylon sp. FL1150]|nr:hypothetical protein GGR53DRAFT_496749 [Hypoxylon sp. FL1150]